MFGNKYFGIKYFGRYFGRKANFPPAFSEIIYLTGAVPSEISLSGIAPGTINITGVVPKIFNLRAKTSLKGK